MKKSLVIRPPFTDEVHLEDIRSLKREIQTHVSVEARHNGEQNIPKTLPEFSSLILNYVQTKIQGAIEKNQRRFQPISGMVIAKQISDEASHKIQTLENERRDFAHTKEHHKRLAEELKPNMQALREYKLTILAAACIGITDGAAAYQGFRYAPMPAVIAILACLGLAVGIFLAAHHLGGYIRRATNDKQLRARYMISVVPAALVFYGLGWLRANAYSHVPEYLTPTGPAPSNLSVWSIAVVSFLLYWLALFLSFRCYRSKAEKARYQQYTDEIKKVTQAYNAICKIDLQIATIRRETTSQVEAALAKYEFALACESDLQVFAQQVIEEYKTTNLRYRTDGVSPDFFSTVHQFEFITFFNKAKNLKK